MEPIISVKNISKKYNITHQQGGYVALRDVIADIAKHPLNFLKYKAKKMAGKETKEEFWALKDVSFEIQKGEAVGIIGANGAGKSTLLKLLSKITPPTTGTIEYRGKMASLLEVGTGFHPELTGRENIFLNGAILGMTKKEIVKKFDSIIKFAEIERFLDTPVKRYSSGMYVRLAFAIAAHMEPDILVVDEVLAVGDTEFQKKCLGKMDEVTKTAGRTILFVSHNISAVQKLCKRCILLEGGRVKMIGETKDVVAKYLNNQTDLLKTPLKNRDDRKGNGVVKITNIEITNSKGDKNIKSFDSLNIKITLNKDLNTFSSYRLILGFYDEQFRALFRIDSDTTKNGNTFIFKTNSINLVPQLCIVNIALFIDENMSDYIPSVYSFEISKQHKKNVHQFSKDSSTILIETQCN